MVARVVASLSAVATVRVQLWSLATKEIPARKSARNGRWASCSLSWMTRPSARARPVLIACAWLSG